MVAVKEVVKRDVLLHVRHVLEAAREDVVMAAMADVRRYAVVLV